MEDMLNIMDNTDLYIKSSKYIIDNFNITTINKTFEDPNGPIMDPNAFLQPLFNSEWFKVEGTDSFYFHNKKYLDWLREYKEESNEIDFESALEDKQKRILLCFGMHPRAEKDFISNYKKYFFDELFKDEIILTGVRKGRIVLFLFFGWEADNFHVKHGDYYRGNYTEVFLRVIDEYCLPSNSIIILSSNLMGNQQYKDAFDDYNDPRYANLKVIYDNIIESATFKSVKGKVDVDYTFDDYIKSVKDTKTPLLRLNRTHLVSRDIMLWYLYKSNNVDKCIIEHSLFSKTKTDLYFHLNQCVNFCKIMGFNHLIKYFEPDDSLYKKIINDLPFIGSDVEKNGELPMGDIHSNETIPHDVYKKTIFSWVSTSLANRDDQVFINQSTFNPMLYYHPIIYCGNYKTAYYLKSKGFMGYGFFSDEEMIDYQQPESARLVTSINDIDKLLKMSRNELIKLIVDNRHIMEHNRNLLLQCNSIERIIIELKKSLIPSQNLI